MTSLLDDIERLEDGMAVSAMISCVCAIICNDNLSGSLDCLESEIESVLDGVLDYVQSDRWSCQKSLEKYKSIVSNSLLRVICLRYDHQARAVESDIIAVKNKIKEMLI